MERISFRLFMTVVVSLIAAASCTTVASMQNFYNGKVSAASSSKSMPLTGPRSVSLSLNDNIKIDLDNSLKLKLKLKLKSPRRAAIRRDPPAGTTWNLVGIGPDGTRYASAFDASGNTSVSLPSGKILSLYVEEVYSGYTNAMLLSYPDGGVSFRNGPSTTGTTDAIVLGTPVVTNGLCTAPVQPDSNISTSGNGLPDAAVYTDLNMMDRYHTGVLDIYPVLDANQDGIPDAYEMASGMMTIPALDANGNIGICSATNTNSPAVVLALTVDPNTAAYTDAPTWSNAQVSFALDNSFMDLRTNYLSDWSNSVVTVVLQPAFQNVLPPVLTGNWSNAAAAVTLLPAFAAIVPSSQTTQLVTLKTAVSNNTAWAAQTNAFGTSPNYHQVLVTFDLDSLPNSPAVSGVVPFIMGTVSSVIPGTGDWVGPPGIQSNGTGPAVLTHANGLWYAMLTIPDSNLYSVSFEAANYAISDWANVDNTNMIWNVIGYQNCAENNVLLISNYTVLSGSDPWGTAVSPGSGNTNMQISADGRTVSVSVLNEGGWSVDAGGLTSGFTLVLIWTNVPMTTAIISNGFPDCVWCPYTGLISNTITSNINAIVYPPCVTGNEVWLDTNTNTPWFPAYGTPVLQTNLNGSTDFYAVFQVPAGSIPKLEYKMCCPLGWEMGEELNNVTMTMPTTFTGVYTNISAY